MCWTACNTALGVLLSVWLPSMLGFAFGSLLLGLPFTAITLFAMQEARRLRPHSSARGRRRDPGRAFRFVLA